MLASRQAEEHVGRGYLDSSVGGGF
jgi:hypothetical protein